MRVLSTPLGQQEQEARGLLAAARAVQYMTHREAAVNMQVSV